MATKSKSRLFGMTISASALLSHLVFGTFEAVTAPVLSDFIEDAGYRAPLSRVLLEVAISGVLAVSAHLLVETARSVTRRLSSQLAPKS